MMLLHVLAHTTIRGVFMDEKQARQPGWAEKRVDEWISAMERLRLADYIRYVDDRKKLLWSHFWAGVARGVGAAIGFTVLGAILILILQDLARRNLPLIGDALAQIVTLVQRQLE